MTKNEVYEAALADILAFSGGARMMTVTQISKYTGRNRHWVYDHYGESVHGGMTVYELARRMTE